MTGIVFKHYNIRHILGRCNVNKSTEPIEIPLLVFKRCTAEPTLVYESYVSSASPQELDISKNFRSSVAVILSKLLGFAKVFPMQKILF